MFLFQLLDEVVEKMKDSLLDLLVLEGWRGLVDCIGCGHKFCLVAGRRGFLLGQGFSLAPAFLGFALLMEFSFSFLSCLSVLGCSLKGDFPSRFRLLFCRKAFGLCRGLDLFALNSSFFRCDTFPFCRRFPLCRWDTLSHSWEQDKTSHTIRLSLALDRAARAAIAEAQQPKEPT